MSASHRVRKSYSNWVRRATKLIFMHHIEVSSILILIIVATMASFWVITYQKGSLEIGDKQLLTLVTVGGMATIGWIVQSCISIIHQRSQQALNSIFQMRSDPEFNRHRDNIFKRFPPRKLMSQEDAEELFRFWRSENKDPNDFGYAEKIDILSSARYLLNYYDFMALAIREGHMDIDIFANSQRTILREFFKRFEHFINATQNETEFGGKTSWRHFVWLVKNERFINSQFKE